jgi:hypothetical protein
MSNSFKSNLNLQYGNLFWTIYKVIKVEAAWENNECFPSLPRRRYTRYYLFIYFDMSLFNTAFELSTRSEHVKGRITIHNFISYAESLKGFQ